MTRSWVEGDTTFTVTSSPWTVEDRALMLAWRQYQQSLCPGCGFPREMAWHPDMDGDFEVDDTSFSTCYACTARQEPGEDGIRKPVTYEPVAMTRDFEARPLPPFPTSVRQEVSDLGG